MKFLAVGFVIFAVHRRGRDVGGNVCCAAEVSYPMTGVMAYWGEKQGCGMCWDSIGESREGQV